MYLQSIKTEKRTAINSLLEHKEYAVQQNTLKNVVRFGKIVVIEPSTL